jgi:hypothetical protein
VPSGQRRFRIASRDTYFAGRFEEHLENLEGLFLKPNPVPVLTQFSPSKVEFKRPKAHI